MKTDNKRELERRTGYWAVSEQPWKRMESEETTRSKM